MCNDTQHPAQTLTIAGTDWPIENRPIKANWIETAHAKGFDLVARIADRYHLAARCKQCGTLNKMKRFTLFSASGPICQNCLRRQHEEAATVAGVVFLRRDPDDTRYAWYRMACGHEIRRQFGCIQKVAARAHGLRCETCHQQWECDEAEARGWELLGPDPQGDGNYRLYRHGCGQVQRIARANMQTGRFDCASCGECWSAAASFLYLMRFTLPSGETVVKLGFGRDPDSRLRHQLLRDKALPAELLRVVAIETGHEACIIEKRLHSRIRRDFPDAVVPRERFASALSVSTEIYEAWLLDHLHARLDRIEARIASKCCGRDAGDDTTAAGDTPTD